MPFLAYFQNYPIIILVYPILFIFFSLQLCYLLVHTFLSFLSSCAIDGRGGQTLEIGERTLCKGGPALILLARERWFCTLPSSHSSKSAGERSGPTGTFRVESDGIFVKQGNVAEWSRALAVYISHIDGMGSNPTNAHLLFCTLTRRTTGMEDSRKFPRWEKQKFTA